MERTTAAGREYGSIRYRLSYTFSRHGNVGADPCSLFGIERSASRSQGQVSRTQYRGCPLFGGSIITVI